METALLISGYSREVETGGKQVACAVCEFQAAWGNSIVRAESDVCVGGSYFTGWGWVLVLAVSL